MAHMFYGINAPHKGGVAVANKKMGRPTDNPKSTAFNIRIDNESVETLMNYCNQESVTKAEAIRRGIKKLKDDIEEK